MRKRHLCAEHLIHKAPNVRGVLMRSVQCAHVTQCVGNSKWDSHWTFDRVRPSTDPTICETPLTSSDFFNKEPPFRLRLLDRFLGVAGFSNVVTVSQRAASVVLSNNFDGWWVTSTCMLLEWKYLAHQMALVYINKTTPHKLTQRSVFTKLRSVSGCSVKEP